MKRLLIAAVALASLPAAQAQTALTSSTPVIGFYKFDVPAGTSAWVVGFVTKKEFQGAATSVAPGANQPDGTPTTVITQSGVTWANNQFPLHYAEVLSTGSQQGAVLDVVSNTATTITVRGSIATPPTFCVRKHVTLATALPEAVTPSGGQGLVPGADTVSLYNSNNTVSSYYPISNGVWLADDFVTPAGSTIIYPGQGFIISCNSPVQLTIGGGEVAYVKTGPTQVPLYIGQTNFVGLINPLVITNPADPLFNTESTTTAGGGFVSIGASGITSSGLLAGQDTVTVFNQGGDLDPFATFYPIGSNVFESDFTTVANSFPLRNGQAMVITVETASRVFTQNQQHPVPN